MRKVSKKSYISGLCILIMKERILERKRHKRWEFNLTYVSFIKVLLRLSNGNVKWTIE